MGDSNILHVANTDEKYMLRALELAKLGWGKTNPNPLVGCVIVKNNKIIGEGFHEKFGGNHAEINALKNVMENPKDSTLYVNLEPCSHYGKTPPCVNAIIDAGISRVVIGMQDPNPLVAGQGIKMLQNATISVQVGVLESEAQKLNEIFIKYITTKKPFVILKTAMTLDGKIASTTGDSKWITSEKSRELVHILRGRVAAIMVGINTVLSDNPTLNTRCSTGTDAARVIIDSTGKIPINSNVITVLSEKPTILITTDSIPFIKEQLLIEKNILVLKCRSDQFNSVDIVDAVGKLYEMGIDSILLEGGGNLNSSALAAKIVDKVMFFIAPKIIGGKNAVTSVEGYGIQQMCNAIQLKDVCISKIENDTLIEAYIS